MTGWGYCTALSVQRGPSGAGHTRHNRLVVTLSHALRRSVAPAFCGVIVVEAHVAVKTDENPTTMRDVSKRIHNFWIAVHRTGTASVTSRAEVAAVAAQVLNDDPVSITQ